MTFQRAQQQAGPQCCQGLVKAAQVNIGSLRQAVWAQVKEVLLSGVLDVKQLQLKEGQAWKLFLDIYVLNADGCLSDVCLLAAVAALLGLRLPNAEIDDEGKVSSALQFAVPHRRQECLWHHPMM